jgi:hypothetical protein
MRMAELRELRPSIGGTSMNCLIGEVESQIACVALVFSTADNLSAASHFWKRRVFSVYCSWGRLSRELPRDVPNF